MYPRGKIWLKGELTSCCLSYVMRCTPKWFYMSTREVKNLMGREKDFLHVNELPFHKWNRSKPLAFFLPCAHPISVSLQPAKFAVAANCGESKHHRHLDSFFWQTKHSGRITHLWPYKAVSASNSTCHLRYNPRQSWQRYLRPLSRVIVWGCRPEPETATRTPPVHRSAMDTFSFSSFI